MFQLLFVWAVVNMVVSIANVVNLIRLKREWAKIELVDSENLSEVVRDAADRLLGWP